MRYYFEITRNNKNYPINIDYELLPILMNNMENILTFDESGKLKRVGKTAEETYKINQALGISIIKYLEKNNSPSILSNQILCDNDKVNFTSISVINIIVDQLALKYNEISIAKEKERNISIVGASILEGDELSKSILKNSKNRDFNKNFTNAISALFRALNHPLLKHYLSQEKIIDAISKIEVLKDRETLKKEFADSLGEEILVKEYLEEVGNIDGYFNALIQKTYIHQQSALGSIVHEIVHSLSFNNGDGIANKLNQLKTNNVIWQNVDLKDLVALNESITDMVTALIMDEYEPFKSTKYNYGAKIMFYIHNMHERTEQNPFLILDAYFLGDTTGLERLAKDVSSITSKRNLWEQLLKNITEMQNNKEENRNSEIIFSDEELINILVKLEEIYYERLKKLYGNEKAKKYYDLNCKKEELKHIKLDQLKKEVEEENISKRIN